MNAVEPRTLLISYTACYKISIYGLDLLGLYDIIYHLSRLVVRNGIILLKK